MFAEQERQWRIEEMKMLQLNRKQRELAQMQEAEEEELKAIIRPESLKTEADFKLTEARKAAAITDFEAKLTEEMEGGFSDESSSVESTSFECTPPLSGSTINPPLITCMQSAPPVTPNVLALPAHLPGVSSTAMASDPSEPVLSSPTSFIQPNSSPSVVQSSWMSASTEATITPLNKPKTGVSSTTTVSSLSPPVVNNLTPSTLPYLSPPVKSNPFVPAFTKLQGTTHHCEHLIVNSVINSLVKGLPISAGDKINLWKFADSATRALAPLTSMNC